VAAAPVVAARAWVRGGARVESVPGQALVTGRLLLEGTRRRDWRRIAEEAEARGMALQGFGAFEMHGLAVDALAADWERALDWLAELLLEPALPEERCRFQARQAAGELESLADQAEVRTAWAFLEQLYAPHPLGRPLQGDAASLQGLVPADCAAFHADGLERGLIVSVAGAIDEEAVRARLERSFAGLAGEARPVPEPPAPAGSAARRREVVTRGADQAHLYLGHPTIARRHPDHAALELLSVVLGAGAGLAGRIPQRIREQEGLAYTAVAACAAGASLDPGRLVVYIGTAPDQIARAEGAAVEELERVLADGLGEREIADARGYLLGREPFRRETARQWAEILAESELFALPLDDPQWLLDGYRALDRQAVEGAARRHLRPDDVRVTVGLPSG
jgi:predicted Zn-dependent peptidase